jgi:hypothetical protein
MYLTRNAVFSLLALVLFQTVEAQNDLLSDTSQEVTFKIAKACAIRIEPDIDTLWLQVDPFVLVRTSQSPGRVWWGDTVAPHKSLFGFTLSRCPGIKVDSIWTCCGFVKVNDTAFTSFTLYVRDGSCTGSLKLSIFAHSKLVLEKKFVLIPPKVEQKEKRGLFGGSRVTVRDSCDCDIKKVEYRLMDSIVLRNDLRITRQQVLDFLTRLNTEPISLTINGQLKCFDVARFKIEFKLRGDKYQLESGVVGEEKSFWKKLLSSRKPVPLDISIRYLQVDYCRKGKYRPPPMTIPVNIRGKKIRLSTDLFMKRGGAKFHLIAG